jgi:RimJ/RimL family protein N-acetyltransferase
VKNVPAPREVYTSTLTLRAFAPADVPLVATAFADPDIQRWNAGTGNAQAWTAGRNDWSDGTHVSWAVADSGGQLVGSVSIYGLDIGQRVAALGYWTGPWARRRGFAVGAVAAAAAVAFDALGLHRLVLYHAVENTASCAVAVQAGFVQEGHLRQSYRYGDGRHHDEHVHGRLVSDPGPGSST